MPRAAPHIDEPRSVGERLRRARLERGLSQRQLAFPGCTASYISLLESGTRVASLQLLQQLAERLGVTSGYLATGEPEGAAGSSPIEEAENALRFGDDAEAEALLRLILRSSDDGGVLARARAGLGQLAFRAGDHAAAIEQLEAARKLWPEAEASPEIADTLGRSYALSGEYERAIGLFERRLAAAEERQDLIETVRFAVLLANTLIDRGSFGRAEELLGRALGLTEDSRDPIVRARLWWSQSRLHASQSDPETAERYAQLALQTLLETEHVQYTARGYQLLAHIKLDQGEAEEALAMLEQGLPLVVESGNEFDKALFDLERARALVRLERPEEAERPALQALASFEGVSPIDSGRAYAVLGDVYEQLGERGRAIETYELALERLRVTDRYQLEACGRLAELLQEEGRKDEALGVLTRALRLRTGQQQRH